MANKPVDIVVLKDTEGNYYVLPRAGLKQAMVPEEYRAEVEKLIQQGPQAAGQGEEMSIEQLESVAGGGYSSIGNLTAPSRLSFNQFTNSWSSRPGF